MDYEKTRVPLYTRRYMVLRQNPLKTRGYGPMGSLNYIEYTR
jgi:hypothetical protein